MTAVSAVSADPIVAFYQGQPDFKGRTLNDIIAMCDAELEYHHDYIQVLFPLPEVSQFNRRAPLIDDATVEAFDDDEYLRIGMVAAYRRMLRFYGFREGKGSKVLRYNFRRKKGNWLNPHNHNFRRLTRMLRCMTLLGLQEKAVNLLEALVKLYEAPGKKYRSIIGVNRMYKWEDAISDPMRNDY